jgi:hypothetical protein
MNADVKRQKMLSGPEKLFDMEGNSSLGSLPRGDIVVRRDFITMTSVDSVNEFRVGAMPRTAEISPQALLTGMARLREQHAGILASKGVSVGVKQKEGSIASFTPDAPQAQDVHLQAVNIDPDQTASQGGMQFVTREGLRNPTNRIV